MAAAMAAFTVVPAHAADTWVAIYYSWVSTVGNTAYGYVTDAPTREDAEAAAKDKCVYNGGTDCRLAAVSKNGCAAVAVSWSGGAWHGGAGATIEEAEQDALAQNNGGTIFIEKCST